MTAPIPTPRITHFQTRPTMSAVSSRAASTRSRSVGVRPSAWRAATGVVNTKGSTHWSSLKRDRTNPIRIAAPSPAATHATMMSIPNVSAGITTAEERGQYEGDAERDPRTQEADEQRDRTAGTERSDRAGGAAGQVWRDRDVFLQLTDAKTARAEALDHLPADGVRDCLEDCERALGAAGVRARKRDTSVATA